MVIEFDRPPLARKFKKLIGCILSRLCVRVVSSKRGGLGKTLFVRRLTDQLPNLVNNDMVLTNLRTHDSNVALHVTVPLHGNSTDSSMLVDSLLPHAVRANVPLSRVFHLDISPSVSKGDCLVMSKSNLDLSYGLVENFGHQEIACFFLPF